VCHPGVSAAAFDLASLQQKQPGIPATLAAVAAESSSSFPASFLVSKGRDAASRGAETGQTHLEHILLLPADKIIAGGAEPPAEVLYEVEWLVAEPQPRDLPLPGKA